MIQKLRLFILEHELVIVVLLITILLRIPSFHEPYWYGDEGIYLTVGNGINHGLHLYKEIYDNKPPGIYFIAALAQSQFWFRFILMIWNLCSIMTFAWIVHLLLDDRSKKVKNVMIVGVGFPTPRYSDCAALLFALLPLATEGLIPNGEMFMILPILLGMGIVVSVWKKSAFPIRSQTLRVIAAGICFSIAFLIKVPALFDTIAAGLFLFLCVPLLTRAESGESQRTYILRKKIGRIFYTKLPYLFIASFVVPILCSILYYAAIGAGRAYINAAFLQNIGYLSSWATGSIAKPNLTSSGLKGRSIVLGVVTLALLWLDTSLTQESLFALLWFVFALFASLLSERPYPHYLVQILAPLTLLVFVFVKLSRDYLEKHIQKTRRADLISMICIGGCLVALVISVIQIRFWNYGISPYYQNYFNFVTHKTTHTQYFSYFDPILPEMYAVGSVIDRLTTPTDRIFIWGDLPTLYALTYRLPPGRYTSAYHILDYNGYDETYQALLQNPPKVIILDLRYTNKFPLLTHLIQSAYIHYTSTAHFALYIPARNK